MSLCKFTSWLNFDYRNDANANETELAIQVNNYAYKHELAFEGKLEINPRRYTPLDPATYKKFRQNDNISHFICRLAYCRNEDLRKWFLAQESRLFQIRLQAVSASEVLAMLNEHLGIAYEALKLEDPEWQDEETRKSICFKFDGS